MWRPEEHPWQYDLLDLLPPGIDEAQIENFLSLTPSERIDELQRMVEFAEPLLKKALSSFECSSTDVSSSSSSVVWR